MSNIELSSLSVQQKVGQVIMSRLDFNSPDSPQVAKQLVREYQVGGFIIFGGTRQEVCDSTKELQGLSDIPLLFACDAERGVAQIVTDMTLFPFTMSLGAIADEQLVYKQAQFIAGEMRECGINLIFAPIVDINSNPDNPIINIRSYGDDAGLVSRMALAFIRGCHDNGVLTCAKHFPGHGATGVDSHEALPVLKKTVDDLLSTDLVTFESVIEGGVASIMTAHIAFPKISKGRIPATISDEIITGVLRNKLGYKGLVITDSLHMAGIYLFGDEGDVAQLSLNAGCDMLLDPKNSQTLIETLCEMAGIGELSEKRLNQAVQSVLSAKRNLDDLSGSSNYCEPGDGAHLVEEIARRSICMLKGQPFISKQAKVCVFDVTQTDNDISGEFTRGLRKNGVDLVKINIELTADLSSILRDIEEDDTVICLIFTTVGAWKKHLSLPVLFKAILHELKKRSSETVLISFGSPYVVEGFDEFDTVMCAFDYLDACQLAAADILVGKSSAEGKLPVKLRSNHQFTE